MEAAVADATWRLLIITPRSQTPAVHETSGDWMLCLFAPFLLSAAASS